MDLHGGSPYWLLLNGLGPAVPPLDRDLRCDVAIIGGGITGALIADELSGRGLSVAVLDRRDLGLGSTVASTALITWELDTPLYQLAASLGLDRARRAYRAGYDAIQGLDELFATLDAPFQRRASLYYADEPRLADLALEFKARKDTGLPVEWLPAAELAARAGLTAAAAIRSTGTAQLDPYRACHALLRRAAQRGAAVHDRTTVTAFDPHTDHLTLHTDRGPVVEAAHLIHATGYESLNLLPPGLVRLRSTFALITEPVTAPPGFPAERDLIWELDDPYLYARWDTSPGGERLLIGGEDEPYYTPRSRDRRLPAKTRALLARFALVAPQLILEPAYAWAGTFGISKDSLPCIGPLETGSRSLHALGFGGNGITAALIAARLLGDLITGRHNPDADLFRPGR